MTILEQLTAARVLPVVTPIDVVSTVELAAALARAGMTAIEITLRSPVALEAIRAVKDRHPRLLVAAGTVLNPQDLNAAVAAGADCCISPGISAALLEAAAREGVGFVPGVATASEVMLGISHGLSLFKLFPAESIGGLDLLRSLHGPFPAIRFCPTGGLDRDNFRTYLALPNVVCCGGSWMVTAALVSAGEWEKVERLAREALN